jgi:hypothetical protein
MSEQEPLRLRACELGTELAEWGRVRVDYDGFVGLLAVLRKDAARVAAMINGAEELLEAAEAHMAICRDMSDWRLAAAVAACKPKEVPDA